MFETALKETKPDARSVTYALQDLNDFVDTHVELCALVYVPWSLLLRRRVLLRARVRSPNWHGRMPSLPPAPTASARRRSRTRRTTRSG